MAVRRSVGGARSRPSRRPGDRLFGDPDKRGTASGEPQPGAATVPYYAKRQTAQSAAVVGIDASKRKHAMVVRPRGGHDSRPLMFEATREGFERAVAEIRTRAPGARPEDVLVGIEFAGSYGFTLAHFLAQQGFQIVSVLGAHSKRWKDVVHNQALKSDRADALTITDLASQGHFVGFPFLEPVYADLRHLVSLRQRLTKLRNGTIARLKEVLQVVWPEFDRRFGNFNKKTPLALLRHFPGPDAFLRARKQRVLKLLREASRGQLGRETHEELLAMARNSVALSGAEGVLKDEIGLQLRLMSTLEEHIAQVERLMHEAVLRTREGEPLLSIPKLGAVAAVFLGSIGDPQSYESSRQALRVAGLSLVVPESGLQRGRPHLSKRGRPELRRQLHMFAVRSVASGGIYREDYLRPLEPNGGRPLPALVAIMRKAARLMFAVARERRTFTLEPPR